MLTMRKGKVLLNLSAIASLTVGAGALQAETINPNRLTGHCNYGDCALFHECTDYHHQENLAELNRSNIVVEAILSPLEEPCHGYSCAQMARAEKCARSGRLAKLVLALRDIPRQ